MKIINKNDERAIRKHFENYRKIRHAVDLRREELIKTSAKAISYDRDNLQPTNRISDPVGIRGQQLAYIRAVEIAPSEVVTHPEKWLKVIENTVTKFNDLRGEVIERRYFRQETPDKICLDMALPKSTFYDWDEDILFFAAMLCVQVGLLKVRIYPLDTSILKNPQEI